MDYPQEGSNGSASPASGSEDKGDDLGIQEGSPVKKKGSTLASSLTIQATPYISLQSPAVSPLASSSADHELPYLLEDLQRQRERLHRDKSVLRGRIAESRQQEQLILLGLNDPENETSSRVGFCQARSSSAAAPALAPGPAARGPYASSPWGSVTLPPVSPLTPLPPGLYHPTPVAPSPLTSPAWLGAQDPGASPTAPNEPSCRPDAHLQTPHVLHGTAPPPSRSTAASPTAGEGAPGRKAARSVDSAALPEQGAYTGRRWSLADALLPQPEDKRTMSTPGLQTVWKDKEPDD